MLTNFLLAVGSGFATLAALHTGVQLGTPCGRQLAIIIKTYEQALGDVGTLRQRQGQDVLQNAGDIDGCGHGESLTQIAHFVERPLDRPC